MLLDVNSIYRSHVFLFLIAVDDIDRHENVSRDFQRQRKLHKGILSLTNVVSCVVFYLIILQFTSILRVINSSD